MGRIPLTGLDWLNYYPRGLKQRAEGGELQAVGVWPAENGPEQSHHL